MDAMYRAIASLLSSHAGGNRMELNSIFIKVLNMGIAATYVILIVLVMRLLFRKLPRIYSYCLWALVGVRLLFPVLIPSAFSLFNLDTFWKVAEEPGQRMAFISQKIEYELTPQINTGSILVDQGVNQILPPANPQGSVNPLQIWLFVGAWIWVTGIVVMLGYMLFSYLRTGKQVKYAVKLFPSVYESDNISSPFVFGVFRPRIYIPFHLEEKEREYILAHEQYHIRRGDPVIKMLAFLIVCVYWFHPLVWLSYVLLGKDMEMSCDEKVLQTLGGEIKEDYSRSLLSFATGKRWHVIQPLAFGESFAGMRIKNVLRFQKPALWLGIAGGLVVVALAFVCLTDREKESIVRVGSMDAMGSGAYATTVDYSFASNINSYLVYAEAYDSNGEYMWQVNLAAQNLEDRSRSGNAVLGMDYSQETGQRNAGFSIFYQPEEQMISDTPGKDGTLNMVITDCMNFSAVFGKQGDLPYTIEAENPCIIGAGYTVKKENERHELYTPEQLRAALAVNDDRIVFLAENCYSFIVYLIASEKDCDTLLKMYQEGGMSSAVAAAK